MTMKIQLKTYGMQMLRWKFIAIQVYLKKQEKHHINNLILPLKQLEKEFLNTSKWEEGKKS